MFGSVEGLNFEYLDVNPVGVAELSGEMVVMWLNRIVVRSLFNNDSTIDMMMGGVGIRFILCMVLGMSD